MGDHGLTNLASSLDGPGALDDTLPMIEYLVVHIDAGADVVRNDAESLANSRLEGGISQVEMTMFFRHS